MRFASLLLYKETISAISIRYGNWPSSNDLLKNCFSGSTRGFFSPFRRILSMLSYHCFFVGRLLISLIFYFYGLV